MHDVVLKESGGMEHNVIIGPLSDIPRVGECVSLGDLNFVVMAVRWVFGGSDCDYPLGYVEIRAERVMEVERIAGVATNEYRVCRSKHETIEQEFWQWVAGQPAVYGPRGDFILETRLGLDSKLDLADFMPDSASDEITNLYYRMIDEFNATRKKSE